MEAHGPGLAFRYLNLVPGPSASADCRDETVVFVDWRRAVEGRPSTGKRAASDASSWKFGRKNHPELNNANAKSKIKLQRCESAPKVKPEVGTTESQVANMKFQTGGCWCGKQQHSRTKENRSRFRNTREAFQQQPDPGRTQTKSTRGEGEFRIAPQARPVWRRNAKNFRPAEGHN